jgi:DNA transformation protein and related proteins
MPISASFLTFALEQLGAIMPVTHRKMFGGAGIYANGSIFAIIDDDAVFLKVDDALRAEFLAAGERVWQPGGGQPMSGYVSVSADVLEDLDLMTPRVRKSLAVAQRAPQKKAPAKQRPSRK